MKLIPLMIFSVLFSSFVYAELRINEVMYNPEGDDNNKEFVEIYHTSPLNLTGWVIGDSASNDTLTLLQYTNSSYSLIVEAGFNYSSIHSSIYSAGATIGNNLGNDGDSIYLYNSSILIDTASYNGTYAAGNGDTLEFCYENWQESSIIWGSPGSENSCIQNQTAVIDKVHDGDTLNLTGGEWVRLTGIDTPESGEYYYEEATERLRELVQGKQVTLERDIENRDMYDRLLRYIYVDDLFVNLLLVEEGFAKAYPFPLTTRYENEFASAEEQAKNSGLGIWESLDYTLLEISEFLPNPEGSDSAPTPGGEWIELYNPTNAQMNLIWMFFKDLAGHTLYITDTNVAETTTIKPNDYLVIYTNGHSLLNNEGIDSISLYDRQGTLIENISYADPIEGNSYAKVNDYWQHTKPTPGEENINRTAVENSVFGIETIYDLGSDKEAKFGQTITAKVNIYKGDETKDSISLWAEDDHEERISKYSKISIEEKYSSHTLTVPVQLYPNCNGKYKDGEYFLKIGWTSGYEVLDYYDFDVGGITNDVCLDKEKKSASGSAFTYLIDSKPDEAEIGKTLVTKVELANNDDADMSVDVWSYVYRGNKCYSGEREENMKSILLSGGESKIVELKNRVKDAEPGDYNFKVKLRKNNQKTTHEITEPITLLNQPKQETQQTLAQLTSNSPLQAALIYESTDERAKKFIPYILISITT